MNIKRSGEILYFISVSLVLWFGWAAARSAYSLMINIYQEFGAELPAWTLTNLQILRSDSLFWIVILVNSLLLYVFIKNRAHFLLISAIILLIFAAYLGFALFSLGMPVALCGEMWPEWPTLLK